MAKTLLIFFHIFLFSNQSMAQAVYVTPYGNHYHRGNCRMVENVSKELKLYDAIKRGYKPCKICKPPIMPNANNLSSNTARGKSNTVQCKGKTASGNRCKHMTSIANGYCFQHNPNRR